MAKRIRIAAEVRLLVTSPVTSKGDGLWQIYGGGPVTTMIEGLSKKVIQLVVDLASLKAAGPTIPALVDHEIPVGRWEGITIDATGIQTRLTLLDASKPESHGLPMFDAAREVQLALDQKFPWQASLGAIPDADRDGFYEKLTEPTEINGRTITPGDMDVFVLRNGLLIENSVVLFGADRRTGKVAASVISTPITPKESTVKERLNALCAQLGAQHRSRIALALAEGATDEAVVADVNKGIVADKDTEIATLKASVATLTSEKTALQTQLDALKPPGDQSVPPGDDKKTVAGAPESLCAAMIQLQAANKNLDGIDARRAALKKWPHLEIKTARPG